MGLAVIPHADAFATDTGQTLYVVHPDAYTVEKVADDVVAFGSVYSCADDHGAGGSYYLGFAKTDGSVWVVKGVNQTSNMVNFTRYTSPNGAGVEVQYMPKDQYFDKAEATDCTGNEIVLYATIYKAENNTMSPPSDAPAAIKSYGALGAANGVGIDRNGRGWIISSKASGANSDRSWVNPLSDDLKFTFLHNGSFYRSSISDDNDQDERYSYETFLFGSPYKWKDTQTTINQMPVSGDPAASIRQNASLLFTILCAGLAVTVLLLQRGMRRRL